MSPPQEPQRHDEDLIERATAALRLAQEDARELARETGTPFLAAEETKKSVSYGTQEKPGTSSPVLRESASDED